MGISHPLLWFLPCAPVSIGGLDDHVTDSVSDIAAALDRCFPRLAPQPKLGVLPSGGIGLLLIIVLILLLLGR